MWYRFRCAACGAELSVTSLEPGQPIPCEACGAVVTMPADAEEVEGLPPSALEAEAAWNAARRAGKGAGFVPALPGLLVLLAVIQACTGIVEGLAVAEADGLRGLLSIGMAVLWSVALLGLAQAVRMLVATEENLRALERKLAESK